MSRGEPPEPPAAAYFEMVEIIERVAGPRWFTTASPRQGVGVIVVGDDGVETFWGLSYEHVGLVRQAVYAHPTLRWVSAVPYIDKEPST